MVNEHIEKLRELVECTKSDEAFEKSRYTDEGSREQAVWILVAKMSKRVMYAVKEAEDEKSLIEIIDLVKEYMGKGYEKKFEDQVYHAVKTIEKLYGNTDYHYLLEEEKKALIKKEFLSVKDYYEFDIRRSEFSVLGTKDKTVLNHLVSLFDSIKIGEHTLTKEYDEGVIEECFDIPLNIIEAECAADIARNDLTKFREENDIYNIGDKMIEYRNLVRKYTEKIKSIREKEERTLISVFDIEEYKKNILKEMLEK